MDLLKNEKTPENWDQETQDFSGKQLKKRCALKKSLIKTHYCIWKSMNPIRAFSIKSMIVYASIIVRQVQILSFLVLKKENTLNSSLEKVCNLLMFQTYSMKIDSSDIFTNFSLVFGFFLYGCIFCIFLQMYLKKSFLLAPFVIIIKFITFGLSFFLLIPILNNSFYYVKTNTTLNDLFFGSEVLKKLVFIIHSFLISSHYLLFNLFSYESDYLSQEPQSRSSSLLTFQEEFLIILICVLNQAVSQAYLLVFAFVISVYELKDFAFHKPFYKFFENFLVASKWLTICLLSLLSIVEEFIGLNGQSLLCFLFMLPSCYILLYNYMKRLQDWSLGSEITTPLLFELHLRRLLYRKKDLEEDEIEEIEKLFEKYTPIFLGYQIMSVWECEFIIQVKEDYPLASIKLLKMIYSYKNFKSFKKPQKIFEYPYSIECEFHKYCLMKKLKTYDKFKEHKLLKYIKDLIFYREMDVDGCYKIVSIIDSYLSDRSFYINELDNKFLELYQSIDAKDEFYSKCIEKYGNDYNFLEIYTGFKNDLMIVDAANSFNSTKTRDFFVEKLTGNNNTINLPTLILSGNPETFCKIIYANDLSISLFRYPDQSSMIGLNYQILFHDIFPSQKTRFFNYVLLEKKTVIEIDQVFFVDYYGYAVEASAEIRLSYLKDSYYFILYLNQLNSGLNYILINPEGNVITCSERLKSIFNGYQHTIEDVLPGFISLLTRQPENHDFYYNGPTGYFQFRFCTVQVKNGFVYVVYTSEQDSSLNYSRSELHKSRKKSISFSGKMIQDVIKLKNSVLSPNRKNRISAEVIKNNKTNYVDQSMYVVKTLKLMRYGNLVSIIIQTLLYAILSIYCLSSLDDTGYTDALYSICSIRFNLASTLLSLRSIDLLKQGVAGDRDFSFYASTLLNNFNSTEIWLQNLTAFEKKFSTKSLFEKTLIELYTYTNGDVEKNTENLYQSIYLFNSRLRMFISSNFTDRDSLFFLYKNGFSTIQDQVNKTLDISYKVISSKAQDMFKPIKIITLLTYFPFSIVLIISLFVFPKLQKLNRYYLKQISALPRKNLILIRGKIADRIKRLHDSTFSKHHEINEPKIKHSLIGKKYFISLLFLIFAVVGFGVFSESVIENNISKTIEKKLEFSYFGELRTTSIRAFFWVRESNLRNINKNIQISLPNFTDFSDESTLANTIITRFHYINHYSLSKAFELNPSFNYNSFLELLIGGTCTIIPFPNCSSSFLSNGIYKSALLLISDYKLAESLPSYSNTLLKNLEQKTILYTSNTDPMFSIFNNCSKDSKSNKSIYLSAILILSFLAVFYFYFFIIKELARVKDLLLSRDIFIKFLEKSRRTNNSSTNLSNTNF